MTDISERPPRAMAATRPGRVVGLDGIRGPAPLFVVPTHFCGRAWPASPADHAPFWAAWLIYGRGGVAMFIYVRAPLPAAPRVDRAATGDVGQAVAAAAN